MKPIEQHTIHTVETVDEDFRMKVDQDSLAHIMSVLTNLYSNRLLAVIREYSTNAWDSHLEAGNTDPIQVTLPTALKPNLVIQDFGIGLDLDDLRDTYSMYGRSTKRGDNVATGMLGLGSKAGLTYALSFSVTAVKNGVKTIVSVTKDEDGVGIIKVLDTDDTDEPNGVTINIPIKSFEIERCRREANDFYKYWRAPHGRVLVDGKEPEPIDGLWVDEDILVMFQRGHSQIVMGNVPYPFEVPWKKFSHSIIAWVPIGTVGFVPSRESLQENRRTSDTLETVIDFTMERFEASLRKRMNDAKSPWERLEIAHKWQYTVTRQPAANGYMPLKTDRKTLFHLGSVIPLEEERPAWQLASGTARKIAGGIPSGTLVNDYHVVKGFPYKGVSRSHKARMEQLKIDRAIFIPDEADTAILEGRDKVIEWDDVVAKTTKPKIVTGPGSPRVQKTYTWLVGSRAGNRQSGTKIPGDDPIVYYGMREYMYGINWDMFPKVRRVQLYANEVKGFLSKHPKAMHYRAFYAEEQKKALAAIGEGDRITHSKDPHIVNALKPHIDKLDDPVLRFAIKTASEESRAYQMVKNMSLAHQIERHPIWEQLMVKYPLLYPASCNASRNGVVDDLITYLNTKHNQGAS